MTQKTDLERELPGSAYRLLVGISLLASEIGAVALARQIAEQLVELRPDLPHAATVLGMCLFQVGQRREGLRSLQDTAAAFPDYQMGKAMLGVCMVETGETGWQDLLEAVIEDGRDEHAVALASKLLGRDAGAPAPAGLAPSMRLPSHAVWA